ncbi:heparin/heparin-sulfate lyase HepB [Bacteroides sp. 51]|uniref:heparin/heparin-sulfate lyase HepB n=1 Tax=Bacteroides sp. 51 TaxID=2302938 RepID=UPI0013D8DF1F|nr:heparin/heparin-sulfate lyase HepB [Bacteroides sp. 51]NDV82141.1 heparinase [Bacteroides sp. 51]
MNRKLILLLTLASFIFVSLANAQSQSDVQWQEMEGVLVPLPPQTHPRLYVRSSDLPDLKVRMNDPRIKEVLSTLRKLGQDRTPEEENKVTDHGFRYYHAMRGVTSRVQLQALDYLVHGNKKQARSAITAMLDTLQRTNYGIKGDLSRASGAMLMCGAMVYDWCYDQMKPGEKKQYIEEFIRIAKTLECGYPPHNREPIAGHSSEWMVLRDLLSTGIAIYDEHPDMYNHVIKLIFKDYIPVRDYTYAGHNYHQGTGYLNVRLCNDLFSQWILDRMGAGPIYSPSQQFVLYDVLYRRRPDGQVMPAGDVNPNRKNLVSYSLPALLAYSYYKDPYLAYEYQRKPSVENHCLIFEVLWKDLSIQPKAPDDLPLTRYSGSPFGWMTARTGWGENSVIAEMKINEQFYGNHQHLDGGSFQLYYKGPLAIDAGAYNGTSGGYNSPHNKNFFKRTIAHNSLLVYNPDEKFACWNYGGADKTEFAGNDGGQRMPGDRWETCRSFRDLLSESYTVGKALAHGFGPDRHTPTYSYLKGDITSAYTDKVKEMKRSFVFLNLQSPEVPAALIVFDKVVSSNPDFKKYWLLHSIEEPDIKNNAFTVKRTKNGDSGMLYNQVLLPKPDEVSVEKVGGPGKEFWVFGTNYPNAALPNRPDPANERGEWRVEVSPASPAAENYFLNVMQVADNTCNQLHEAKRIDADRIVGVQLADHVVTFSKNSQTLSGKLTMQVSGNSPMKFVITDLAPGTWQIKKDGKLFIPALEVRSDDGIACFEGQGGYYELSR